MRRMPPAASFNPQVVGTNHGPELVQRCIGLDVSQFVVLAMHGADLSDTRPPIVTTDLRYKVFGCLRILYRPRGYSERGTTKTLGPTRNCGFRAFQIQYTELSLWSALLALCLIR